MWLFGRLCGSVLTKPVLFETEIDAGLVMSTKMSRRAHSLLRSRVPVDLASVLSACVSVADQQC